MRAVKYEKEAKKGIKHRFGFNLKMPIEDVIKPENMKKIQKSMKNSETEPVQESPVN